MQRWECSVCGYIHEGTAPPDACPVCGVDSTHFSPLGARKTGLLREMRETFQPHAVAVHFPTALLPTALLFLIFSLLIDHAALESASSYLLYLLLPCIPVAMATGIYHWQTRFGGRKAPIFNRKIILATTLLGLTVAAAGLRFLAGGQLAAGGALLWLYVLLLVGMLGCVTLLGHYGGKLVFSQVEKE